MIRFVAAFAVTLAISAGAAMADIFQTYTLQYENVSVAFGPYPSDPGLMSGVVTLDTTALPNPSPPSPSGTTFLPIGPYVSSLTLTVTNSPVGDGIYTLADYNILVWDTNGTVDFSKNLIGQISDFNFIDPDFADPNVLIPTGVAPVIMRAGDSGFRLISAEPVPEPSGLIALGAGLLSLAAVRSRSLP